MATIKIIEGHHNLNSVGCSFFLDSNENLITRVTTSNLRWLSIRESNDEYFSDEQQRACERIDDIFNRFNSNIWDKLNIRILLFANPTKTNNSYLNKLIAGGADVRFYKSKSNVRMALCGKRLFLARSSDNKKVVNQGWLYEGRNNNDPFLDFYKDWFDNKFEHSSKIILKNGKLRYEKTSIERIIDSFRNITIDGWINILLSAVLGALIGCLSVFL